MAAEVSEKPARPRPASVGWPESSAVFGGHPGAVERQLEWGCPTAEGKPRAKVGRSLPTRAWSHSTQARRAEQVH